MGYLKKTRKVDNKGRVFIPREVLEIVGIKEGDSVTFETTKAGGIVIRKYIPPKRGTDDGE